MNENKSNQSEQNTALIKKKDKVPFLKKLAYAAGGPLIFWEFGSWSVSLTKYLIWSLNYRLLMWLLF